MFTFLARVSHGVVLVQKTASGILLPEQAAGPSLEGVVRAVGPGALTEVMHANTSCPPSG